MRIALDTMGADGPPKEMVLGGVQAAQNNPDAEIVLVGDAKIIDEALQEIGPPSSARISVRHASQVIRMEDSPGKAVIRKPDSSLCRAIEMTARKEADAMVSPGNTGAVVAAAYLLNMGMLQGVKRPGIAVTLRSESGQPSTFIDCGATVGCKAINLCQFALMASVYQERVFGIQRPTVGVLSVGEESTKGNSLVKETAAMLTSSPLNFIGNIEGGDIIHQTCNVTVCDGFVGNAVLKAGEAVAERVFDAFRKAASSSLWAKLGLWLLKPHLRALKKSFDYSEYGGAPLLGVDGAVIICHGRSGARAIMNAIGAAAQAIRHDVNGHIVSELAGKGVFAEAGGAVGTPS